MKIFQLLFDSKYLFLFVVLILFFGGSVFAITDPAIKNPGLDLYMEAPGLDYTTPTWFKPHNQDYAPENISYWLDILPFPQDKNADIYLVIPGLGLITPVIDIPEGSSDYTKMISGEEITINNYLKGGVIEYVSSVQPGYWGKRIDFGHSNYFSSDTGRYKTIFANLMRLDPGDQVRYFVKQRDGSYQLFKYNITRSYPTNPSNVSALQWDGDGADALIFGCYHGLDGRWMVEASYIGDPKGRFITETTVVENQYTSVPFSIKRRVNDSVKALSYMGINARKYEIIILFKGIQKARAGLIVGETNYQLKVELLDMIEEELTDIYPS